MTLASVRRPELALANLATIAGLMFYLVPRWRFWSAPTTLAVSAVMALLALGAAVALARGSAIRRHWGAAILLVGSLLITLDAVGPKLGPTSPVPLAWTLMLAGLCFVAAVGVIRRRRGGRWLALGLGATGLVTSGLNLSTRIWAGVADPFGWTLAVGVVGSLALVTTLCGTEIARQDRLSGNEHVWDRKDPLVHWTRAATLSATVASVMLLVYAWQPGRVETLAVPAIGLGFFLALAAVTAARGKVLGGIMLTVGSAGLVAMSAAAIGLAPAGSPLLLPGYYLAFWLPGAVCGLGVGVALALTVRRSSRGP